MSFPLPDSSLFDHYKLFLQGQGKAQGTVKQYLIHLNAMIRKASAIEDFFADSSLKNKSIKVAAYRSYAKFLQIKKIITRNDLMDIQDAIKSPIKRGNHRSKKKFHIPREQWNEYIERAPNQVAKMGMWIGFNFGLRVSEIVNLRVQDIDFERKELLVQIHDNWHPKRTRERQLPMNQTQVQILERWINDFRAAVKLKHDYLLWIPYHTKTARPYTPVAISTFQVWCKSTGLMTKILRYSFARWFYEASNHDIKLTSEMLGHADVSVTTKYLELAYNDRMTKARKVFNQ